MARVFNLKLIELQKDLKKRRILGKVVAKLHVIEFQKGGLPHAHMLIILHHQDKFRDRDDIDKVVCAGIPDPQTHPRLHQIVKSCIVHGPCGNLNQSSPCMDNGKCTKEFPKSFIPETVNNVDRYPIYRHRNDGKTIKIGSKVVNNMWIVSYNPYLSLKYNAHINVEICSSIQSVKYIFRYVYKGHDCANMEFKYSEYGSGTLEWDETKSFLNARCVSAPEAMWRFLENRMHKQSHPMIRLAVHLPYGQQVYFKPSEEERALLNSDKNGTMLTDWFELNKRDFSARQYLYAEIPQHFVFSQHNWVPRKQGSAISRMYSVSPTDIERFHLHLLLLHVRGATSFEYVLMASYAILSRKQHAEDIFWQMTLNSLNA